MRRGFIDIVKIFFIKILVFDIVAPTVYENI